MAKWNIDPAHSDAQFAVRHLMLSNVKGLFHGVSGLIEFDADNPAGSSVEAAVEIDTLTTGIKDRDEHLKSGDFLDAANHPQMTFRSTSVETGAGGKAWGMIKGDLTIRGITRPVTLEVDQFGPIKDPFKGQNHIGFNATTRIERGEFGMKWNAELEGGGVIVGESVQITLDVEAILDE